MAKSVMDNLWDDQMGTQIPDFIRDRLWDIGHALRQCQAFNGLDAPANKWMFEVAVREAQTIIEVATAAQEIFENKSKLQRRAAEERLQFLFQKPVKGED